MKTLSAKEVEKIAKATGDPYRLKIIELVNRQKQKMQCAGIVNEIGLAQSTVSHHIKLLADAGLLLTKKEGRNMSYEINKETFDAYIHYLTRFL